MPPDLGSHYKIAAKAFIAGRVVPFLGAGANLCGRSSDAAWTRGVDLPSGRELAEFLAESYGYPKDDARELTRVSQYVSSMTGLGPLYSELHALFDTDYPMTGLHQFLARLPATMRGKGGPARAVNPIVVTTNYDDLVERAYREAGEPFDVVTYIAEGEGRSGKFAHRPWNESEVLIEIPNEYRRIPIGARPVILKIHGTVDREDSDRDSFVITEDHYIDYLTRTELTTLLPVQLAAALRQSHFLFLGYSLADWNLRVILHRIWGQQKLSWKSWAIQREPKAIDQRFWSARDVDVLDVDLGQYVGELQAAVEQSAGS